jgi:D-alanyl-D-alanine carboxypeptidase
VTKGYVPPDLVPVSDAGIGGSGKVRSVVIADLEALADAAKAAGNPIAVKSAYRSYAKQVSTFQYWVNLLGRKQALLVSARPGHSEHQLGLAIDFKTAGGGSPFEGDWGESPAGSWMRKHAWQYGWLQSYPKGQRSKTCYAYESWHFRYVGRDLAAAIHASGLTTREYLWSHFTTAVVPTGSPAGTPTPAATVRPTARPSHAPSSEPTSAPTSPSSPPAAPSQSPAVPSPSTTAGTSPLPSPSGGSPAPSVGPTAPAGADAASVAAVIGLGLGMLALATALLLRRRRAS